MSSDGTRLYLVTSPLASALEVEQKLTDALAAGDIACVLVQLAARDEADAKKIVRAVTEAAGRRDTATLVMADPTLAVRAGADGVHMRGIDTALREALVSLVPERIVGCGGLKLRDDAMQAGEAGVDYVMFGEPSPDGRTQPFDETLERVAWWAEIFSVPCVGWASRPGDVTALAAAGADFVALGDWVWSDERGAAAAIREAQGALEEARTVAGTALG